MRTIRKAIPRLTGPIRSKCAGIAAPKSETWSMAGAWRISDATFRLMKRALCLGDPDRPFEDADCNASWIGEEGENENRITTTAKLTIRTSAARTTTNA